MSLDGERRVDILGLGTRHQPSGLNVPQLSAPQLPSPLVTPSGEMQTPAVPWSQRDKERDRGTVEAKFSQTVRQTHIKKTYLNHRGRGRIKNPGQGQTDTPMEEVSDNLPQPPLHISNNTPAYLPS